MTPTGAKTRRDLATSPFSRPAAIPPAHTRMSVGTRVTHDRLGLGRVVSLIEEHDVIVDFGLADGSYRRVTHTALTTL